MKKKSKSDCRRVTGLIVIAFLSTAGRPDTAAAQDSETRESVTVKGRVAMDAPRGQKVLEIGTDFEEGTCVNVQLWAKAYPGLKEEDVQTHWVMVSGLVWERNDHTKDWALPYEERTGKLTLPTGAIKARVAKGGKLHLQFDSPNCEHGPSRNGCGKLTVRYKLKISRCE